MFRALTFATCLAVIAAPMAIVRVEAAEADQATAGFAGRFAHTPLGKLISGRLGRAMVLRSELDVTPEQRKEIRTILTSHRKEIASAVQPVVKVQMHRARKRLRKLTDPPADT